MTNIIEREQKYYDMIKEALNIGRIIKGEPIDECREEVIDVLAESTSFDEYRRIVPCYVLPEDINDLSFSYQAKALAVVKYVSVKNGIEYDDTTYMRIVYNNNDNFLYMSNVFEEDGIILNQNGQVGWRDLREHDELDWIIYDYFRDENEEGKILKFRKPEVEGYYSNQTPEVITTYAI